MESTKLNQAAPAVAIEKREFLDQLAEMVQVPKNTLKGPETLGSYEWDSLAVITFQAFLDERFGIRIPHGRIAACDTFDELFDLTQEFLAS